MTYVTCRILLWPCQHSTVKAGHASKEAGAHSAEVEVRMAIPISSSGTTACPHNYLSPHPGITGHTVTASMTHPPPNWLRANHSHWRDIGTTDTILSWLKEGVPVPFRKDINPPRFPLGNPPLSPEHPPFVQQELKDLLQAGFIDTCQEPPRCVSPIKVVPKKGHDKFRLITDLRLLNDTCVSSKL